MSKKSIWLYSNPTEAYRRARKYIGKTAKIGLSTKKEKKYMVQIPDGKIVHFGQMGYEDYTKHKDKIRRKNFQSRNFKWQFEPPYTPSHLSWYILW